MWLWLRIQVNILLENTKWSLSILLSDDVLTILKSNLLLVILFCSLFKLNFVLFRFNQESREFICFFLSFFNPQIFVTDESSFVSHVPCNREWVTNVFERVWVGKAFKRVWVNMLLVVKSRIVLLATSTSKKKERCEMKVGSNSFREIEMKSSKKSNLNIYRNLKTNYKLPLGNKW